MNEIWKSRFSETSGADLQPPKPMPSLIWRWLSGRGLTTQKQIDEFLTPKLGSLSSPQTLKGMDKALARLKKAYELQEAVCVYGDYDLDGSSGIALLVAGLKGLGFQKVSFYQPSRFLEGYGIHREALDIIAGRGDRIVISVDCGITAVEEAEHAKELKLDLIITDHHLARKTADGSAEIIPDALAVINPNQAGCTSNLGHISGVGVGFYLLLGLKAALKEFSQANDFDLKSLLDLFSIGTITDMVPLKRENRVLVKHGLKVLAQTKRPGLQALMKRLDLLGRDIDSTDVAFTLAPKLNALSRLEQGLRPLDIFMCEDFKTAEVLAEKVLELNEKRKLLQAELEERILSQLDQESENPVIVLAAQGHAGVVGLVATKATQLTGKPAFIVAWHDGDGIGSARGREEDQLPDALARAGEFLERYGGHAQAAGFSLRPEKFEDFKKALIAHYRALRSDENPVAIEKVFDADANLEELNENFMSWLKHAGPFGSENPTPLFRISVDRVAGVRWLKGQHLKLTLREGALQIDALAFFARGNSAFQVEVGEKIELLAEPGWNYFRGERRLQLMIRALRHSPAT